MTDHVKAIVDGVRPMIEVVDAKAKALEARIDDWQGIESHSSFAGRLREAFGSRWSFWQLLER